LIVYLNGQFVDAAAARVSLFDGGYLYGDGLYETLRLYGGQPADLEGHLGRLCRELELLGYGWRPDPAAIRLLFAELAARNGLAGQDARARLTVSRGGTPDDPLPLDGLDALPETVSAWVAPIGPEVAQWQQEGVAACVMKSPFARGNFPQLKTLNYLPALVAMRFARAEGCQEALLVDRQGKLLEGTTSNLFLVRDGCLLTPAPRLGLLAGRTRARVLALAGEAGLRALETAFDRRDLLTAPEAFLSGSVKEIVPLVRVDGLPVGDGVPGPVTRDLQKRYRQAVLDDLAADRAAAGSGRAQ
jgi:branched-subunit amino acid aminotransferase/4-amino-4-deoxychorismate lyase